MDLRVTLCYVFVLSATEILGGDAQVCSTAGAVQLVGFNSPQVGIVQVCKEGHWGTICSGSSWGKKSSLVVCRQLGFPDAVDLSVIDRLGVVPASSPIHYSSVQCTGLEGRLTDCMMESSNITVCSHSDDVVVMCKQSLREGDIRIVGQGPQNKGILEFYSQEHGWATLCTSDWDDSDAQVACTQLGYKGGKSNTSRFIPSLPRKRYNNFDCSGSENSLLDCRFSGPFPIRCYTADYAGVQCRKSGADESVSLNISILILVTGVAFCLIAGLSIALKCTVSRLRKKYHMDTEDRSSTERHNYGPCRIPRVMLDSSAWTDRQLDPFTTLAPPSYEDTVLADQTVQAQPQQQDILPPHPPTTTEGTTNERPAGNKDSSQRDSTTDCNLGSASNTNTITRASDTQEEDSCTVYLTTSKQSAETVLSEQRDHVVQVEET